MFLYDACKLTTLVFLFCFVVLLIVVFVVDMILFSFIFMRSHHEPFVARLLRRASDWRSNIFGIKSYQNVKDIPEEDGIDLAIIAVPSRAVKEVSICLYVLCVVYVVFECLFI